MDDNLKTSCKGGHIRVGAARGTKVAAGRGDAAVEVGLDGIDLVVGGAVRVAEATTAVGPNALRRAAAAADGGDEGAARGPGETEAMEK